MVDGLVAVGKISRVHGVRGWLKIHSYTEPEANIIDYQPWWVSLPGGGYQALKIDDWRAADKGILVHVQGIDDRDAASCYCQRNIEVDPKAFAQPEAGELYWYQLQGLKVFCHQDGRRLPLGRIVSLMSTGANDVLVVQGDKESIDQRERLLPFLDQYIERIDLEAGELDISWDPDF